MNALTEAADRCRALGHDPTWPAESQLLARELYLAFTVLALTDSNVAKLLRARRFAVAEAWEMRVVTALGEARYWQTRRAGLARLRLLARRRCARREREALEVAELAQRVAARENAEANARER